MKNFDWDKKLVGFVVGILAPTIALLVYYLVNYRYMNIGEFIDYLRLGQTYTPLISLCVLSNLLPFYLLINKEKYDGTKGILAATFIWAGIIIILKFFTE